MKNIEDYLQGYRDVMSYDKRVPHTMIFMGKNMEELAKIICDHEERKFLSDDKWKWPEEDMQKLKERQKEVNKDHALNQSNKYQWAEPNATSNKEFLEWIWQRLNNVFGEGEKLEYMQRFERIIETIPGKSSNDKCVVSFNSKDYPKGVLIVVDGQPVYQK